MVEDDAEVLACAPRGMELQSAEMVRLQEHDVGARGNNYSFRKPIWYSFASRIPGK